MNTRKKYLEGAISIADKLLDNAKPGAHGGIYWETMSLDSNQKVTWEVSDSLYSGSAGITVFLLELYKITGYERYLTAVRSSFDWIEWYAGEATYISYAFYTGKMGVAYAYARMYETTREEHFLKKALDIASRCDEQLNPESVDDILNGASGMLIGLMYLHALSGENMLLEKVDRIIGHLLTKASIGKKGLYWDRSHQQISGLCGFSHGVAGLGYVWLSVARYFENDAFLWLADQAFQYEDQYFTMKRKNWQDLRKGIYSPKDYTEFKGRYLDNDMNFFTRGGDMNAWCHGAAGIGLSRILAYELTGNEKMLKYIKASVAKTALTDLPDSDKRSYTLCHGSGGNAELFINASRLLKDKRMMSYAERVADNCLKVKQGGGTFYPGYSTSLEEDKSLFMGNAGIGYFLLRVYDPAQVPSLMAFPLKEGKKIKKNTNYKYLYSTDTGLKLNLLEKVYPKTLETFGFKDLDTVLGNEPVFVKGFEKAVKEKIRSGEASPALKDAFSLESTKLKMDFGIKSAALLHFVNRMNTEKVMPIEELSSAKSFFTLSPATKIKILKHEWSGKTAKAGESAVLLRQTAVGVFEEILSPFSYMVLSSFEKPKNLDTLLKELIPAFEVEKSEEDAIREAIRVQTHRALMSGILVESE